MQNPISVWVYQSERYFTQLCIVNVPRDKVLEYLFEVRDIQARFCTKDETAGTFVAGDQVYVRLI